MQYFDERGRPVKPYCGQGDRCSFIHPNDPTWFTAPPSRKPASGSADAYRPRPRGVRCTSQSGGRRRQSPLASQSEVFKKTNADAEVRYKNDDHLRAHGHEGKPVPIEPSWDRNHFMEMKFADQPVPHCSEKHRVAYDTPSREKSSSSSSRGCDRKDNETSRQLYRKDLPVTDIVSDVPLRSRHSVPGNDLEHGRDDGQFVDKIVESFRAIAKLTNKAVQDTAAYDKEEEKLRTYSELSATLAKVSPSATSAVAPTLAAVTINHAKYRDTIQSDFRKLGHVWEDVFEHFVTGVVRAVDLELANTVNRWRKEIGPSVIHSDPSSQVIDANGFDGLPSQVGQASRKRKSDGAHDGSMKAKSSRAVHSSAYKRRRLSDLPPKVDLPDGLRQAGLNPVPDSFDPDVLRMLEEMKSRIDMQVEALEKLTEENTRLKLTLDNQSLDPSEADSFIESADTCLPSDASDIELRVVTLPSVECYSAPNTLISGYTGLYLAENLIQQIKFAPLPPVTHMPSDDMDDASSDNGTAKFSSPSPSSSDDAVNDASARVYFGPMQTPEKKFAARSARRRTPRSSSTQSPLRRSARLTSALAADRGASPSRQVQVPKSKGLREIGEEGSSIRQETLEREMDLQDEAEPCSALAERVSRAHDNPSPPPQMLQFLDEDAPDDSPPPRLIDISDTYEANPAAMVGHPQALPFEPCSPFCSPLPDTLPSVVSPFSIQQTTALLDSSQQDLILFDPISSITPSTPPRQTSSLTADTEDQDAQVVVELLAPEEATVDPSEPPQYINLLSPSPLRRSASLSPAIEVPCTPSPASPESNLQPEDKHPKDEELVESGEQVLDSIPQTPQDTSPDEATHGQPSISPTIPSITFQLPPSRSCSPDALNASQNPRSSPRPRRSPRLSQDNTITSPVPALEGAQSQPWTSDTNSAPGPSRRSKARNDKSKRAANSKRRELGSLSPTSADVLSNILAGGFDSNSAVDGRSTPPTPLVFSDNFVLPSTPLQQPSPQLNQKSAIRDVQRPPSAISPLSPSKSSSLSPARATSPLDDPLRSPRRIPIAQAIAEGSLSPDKIPRRPFLNGNNMGSEIGLFGRPVFTRLKADDPIRSPRRVLIGDKTAAPSPARAGSTSPFKAARAGSAEPQTLRKEPFSFKPPSRALSDSELSSPSKPRNALPFPVRSRAQNSGSKLPDSIPEETEAQASSNDAPTAIAGPSVTATATASPAKSSLRQPSSVTSRIPRIGAKPYARPVSKGKQVENKLVVASRKAAANAAPTKPLRIVRKVVNTSSGGSSDDIQSNSAATATTSRTTTRTSQSKGSSLPAVSSLKRKRVTDHTSSPPGVRPIVMIRQVVPGVNGPRYPSSKPTAAPPPPSSTQQPQSEDSPIKKPRILHMRKVEGPPRRTTPVVPKEREPVETVQSPLREQVSKESPSSPPIDVLGPPPPVVDDASPALPPENVIAGPSKAKSPEPARSPEPLATAVDQPEFSTAPSTRRTARSRIAAPPQTDVFGTVRPLQPRRRQRQVQADTGGFPAMSAMALKALTTTNTEKNQQCVARLEKEIVRKNGSRPESPSTKVRTVLERQKEEKGRERKERAERRARRSTDGQTDQQDLSLMSSDDMAALGLDGLPLKHRLGAGDEGYYETPEKKSGEEERARKRVKWDRGLFSTIYLGDLESASTSRETSIKPTTALQRGALSAASKSTQLDNYGNTVHGESPLKNLVQESIVVKKFVYDDDMEAEEVSKPVKGKGKKSKS
ncbi:hypothetical protein EW146_g7984 [Bondarzewia mesenterica]|uniref:C3H1-type domain-containing protein n=1 Tax=Bondarzewia mesenterica TaxID=1095465 RepID=A0A4S4LNE4_9AGAM|nr:hypothetical protein EW146_g7984 [Bondarzewia mesenterica]